MLSGAITTMGSMLFLSSSELVINQKFGSQIILTIFTSLTVTMILLGAMLHLFGPQDGSGDVAKAYGDWRRSIL